MALQYDTVTKELVKTKVRNDFTGHGGEYFTPWEVVEQMLDQFPIDNFASWAVLHNFEKLYATIAYKGVDPQMITFFSDDVEKSKIAINWGCKVVDVNMLTDKKTLKEYMKKFDNTISNNPYNARESSHKGSVDVAGGKMGTVGHKTLGRKLNKIQRDITKPGGNIAQMGLKTNWLSEDLSAQDWNPQIVSLMVDKNYWKFNTFWTYGIKEDNQNSYTFYGTDIDSIICSKLFGLNRFKKITQSNSYMQLYRDGFVTDEDNGNPLTIVRSYKKNDMTLKRAYPTDEGLKKVVFGPKYAQYMQESAVSRLATDEPMLCDTFTVFPTETLDEAKKMKLFTDVNPLLTYFWKKMKIKGRDHFWQYAKKFDLNQIVTGYEYPAEYNLKQEEIERIEQFK